MDSSTGNEAVPTAMINETQKDTSSGTTNPPAESAAPMSKNALKRLRRMKEWEDGKEDRKQRRREKRVKTKARRREAREEFIAKGGDPAVLFAKKPPPQLVPVALILDCGFEDYMTDKERVSLSSQVTRCYSDNSRGFKYKSHLWISGWGGKLKERFENVMESQHAKWKGVGFEEGDFLKGAVRARERMAATGGGEMIQALHRSLDSSVSWEKDEIEPFPLDQPLPQLNEEFKDVVYLTSESPYTLERLEPHTSYVIGGLVDKNREKGLCYRRAVERGIRTAKLPIGQYMVMQSRQILATNHVVEIMLKWLECEDWGEAFLHVIPKRKGGRLRGDADDEDEYGTAAMTEIEEDDVDDVVEGDDGGEESK